MLLCKLDFCLQPFVFKKFKKNENQITNVSASNNTYTRSARTAFYKAGKTSCRGVHTLTLLKVISALCGVIVSRGAEACISENSVWTGSGSNLSGQTGNGRLK
jgi:hypothetical protein